MWFHFFGDIPLRLTEVFVFLFSFFVIRWRCKFLVKLVTCDRNVTKIPYMDVMCSGLKHLMASQAWKSTSSFKGAKLITFTPQIFFFFSTR